ncbi:hypothetical protein PsorP6_001727 [Peronosclerospora sorghi]|uniref:Uncharacterized protein n=1 Tax=Peronosclerospora sorghi TaxID=230839 RepID=A0ACC0WTX5_9STRA|nr:hypothetical protein PsorP6_001727 [Peronosclerospora sorghi]
MSSIFFSSHLCFQASLILEITKECDGWQRSVALGGSLRSSALRYVRVDWLSFNLVVSSTVFKEDKSLSSEQIRTNGSSLS